MRCNHRDCNAMLDDHCFEDWLIDRDGQTFTKFVIDGREFDVTPFDPDDERKVEFKKFTIVFDTVTL